MMKKRKIRIPPFLKASIACGIQTVVFWLMESFFLAQSNASGFSSYCFVMGQARHVFRMLWQICIVLGILFFLADVSLQKVKPMADKLRGKILRILCFAGKGLCLAGAAYVFYLTGKTTWQYVARVVQSGYFATRMFSYSALVYVVAGAYLLAYAFVRVVLVKKRLRQELCFTLDVGAVACFAILLSAIAQSLFSINVNGVCTWILVAAGVYAVVGYVLSAILVLRARSARAIRRDVRPQKQARKEKTPTTRQDNENLGNEPKESFLQRHTGLSFKSLWSIHFAIRLLPYAVLLIFFLLVLSTMFYTIEPYQEALVYHFGTLQPESIHSPGLHFKLPWPFEQTEIYDVDRVQIMQIGYLPSESRDYLWTSEHGGEEYTLMLGGGNELIALNMKLAYSIDNLIDYATSHKSPEDLISSRAYEEMMYRTVSSNLTDVLSVDRYALATEVCEVLQQYSDEMHLGLKIQDVIIENIHPPIEVAEVYQDVVSASIEQNTQIFEATGDASKTVLEAEQESETSVIRAAYTQTKDVAQAEADMAIYDAAYQAYPISPQCYELMKRMEAYEKVISTEKIYVFSEEAQKNMEQYWIANGVPILGN